MKFSIDNYNAFFFDFDGVIVDSVNIKTEAFAEIYRPYGEKAVGYVVRHHKAHGGMSRFLKIRHYHKELLNQDLSDEDLRLLAGKFSDLVLEKVIQATFIKGALSFIHMLSEKNKKMFIVSGTPEGEIQRIVESKQLNNYFLEVRGAPTAKRDNIQYLLKKYKIGVNESVFFGDSSEDFKTASSLGLKFIPINYYCPDSQSYKDFVHFMDSVMAENKR